MSFDWREYFTLALQLETEAKSITTPQAKEARWRSSISRAYYAVFGLTVDLIRDDPNMTETLLRNHGEVHRYLQGDQTESNRVDLGLLLGRMYEHRKKADYNSNVPGLDRMCTHQLGMAQDALVSLRNIRAR